MSNKKKVILDTAKELFIKKNIQQVTLDEIAKKSNIAKGTIYLYFKNKDELVFEVYKELQQLQIDKAILKMRDTKDIKTKIIILFDYYLDDKQKEFINLFINFYTATVNNYSDDKLVINKLNYEKIFALIDDILQNAIATNQIKYQNSYNLTKSICASIDGLFFYSLIIKDFDFRYELDKYLDTLFDILS